MLEENLIRLAMLMTVDSIGNVFLKMCASGHKSCKECVMVMYCANAFGNHKVKLVVVVKRLEVQDHLKGTGIRSFKGKQPLYLLLQPERSIDRHF
jgi:hypothetical protein